MDFYNQLLAQKLSGGGGGGDKYAAFKALVDGSLTEVTAEMLDGITKIRSYAFSYCTRLSSVTIPNSVTSIGVSAFQNCTSLTSVTVKSSIPPSLDTDVFYNTNQIMEYNTLYGVCVKYCYKCPVGQKKYKADELEKKAKLETIDAVLSKIGANIEKVEFFCEDDRFVTFHIFTDSGTDLPIYISYRLDTGSCGYFDSAQVIETLKCI